MAITYNNLYMDTRRILNKAGIEAATLEARELICYAAGKSREEFNHCGQLYAPSNVEEEVKQLVNRHLQGEPVAYIIGEWEFYGMPMDISESVLIPRVDTEVLAEKTIEYVRTLQEPRVLDLCAGSGCIGLAVAKHVAGCHVVLGELDEAALRICRQNIRRNGLSGNVIPYQMNALEKPVQRFGTFDCIVSNPPYIPHAEIDSLDISVKNYEPHLALDGGEDGLDFYRAICEKWTGALQIGGRLYFEVGIGQADEVVRIMRKAGFGDIEIISDTGGIYRVVYGTLCDHI